MRDIVSLNHDWKFIKQDVGIEQISYTEGEKINIPHTWNNKDGQDGGNDYYRGICYYVKEMKKPELAPGGQAYLEFEGVNSSATIYVNGKYLYHHDGGYSTFRINITKALEEDNTIIVAVDNTENKHVYPQRADFTFYGGIYRGVSLICVTQSHFDLDYYGSSGIKVTPKVEGTQAIIQVETFVKGIYDEVEVTIEDIGTGEVLGTAQGKDTTLTIENVHLWDGLKDPYLYLAKAQLIVSGEVVDEVKTKFGCRTFAFDSEKGFILNGKPYPLRGVSRHQDRRDVGNALTKEMHKEDMELIREIGANTIRLAHYQHDQYFYDLCDEYGMVVWAEIPYITEHLPEGCKNTLSQMTELIVQNYNHPAIICWGLSNEITVAGVTDDLIENHRLLNELAHGMDSTRPTVMANVFMLEIDSPLLAIPDILSYNLYFGWYVGNLDENDKWFDDFHTKYPNKVIGLSEYGADACPRWQTATPERGDYTEQYQCVYHEHMLKMFEERPYIWATHAWNMFDFGADGRDEGGENGVNQKGLVTFDRKVKKDAFYLYKAYLSDRPFVHLCGKKYMKRHEEITEIKVYSNQDKVALYNNGELVEEQKGKRIFTFKLPIAGEHYIEVRCNGLTDSMNICKVTEQSKEYELMQKVVHNWFEEEMTFPEGYFSIKDTMGEICKTPEGAAIIEEMMSIARTARGDVAQNVKPNAIIQNMLNAMSVEALVKQAGGSITAEMVLNINKALNQIEKTA